MRNPKLKIHIKTDPFEDVPQIQNKTEHQLKIFIRDMVKNLQNLANVLDDNRPDISKIIDKMLDGHTWKENDVQDNLVYAAFDTFVIRYNTKTKVFDILDHDYNPVQNPLQGVTRSEVKEEMKNAKKS